MSTAHIKTQIGISITGSSFTKHATTNMKSATEFEHWIDKIHIGRYNGKVNS